MAKTKTTYRLRLKSGQHIWTDRSRPILDPDTDQPTGRFERGVANQGEVFTSNVNLAEREPERYELVGGKEESQANRIAELEAELTALRAQQGGVPTPEGVFTAPAVAPGGQVSTGYQRSSGIRSAPMSHQEAVEAGASVPAASAQEAAVGKEDVAQPPKAQPPAEENLDDMTVSDLRERASREGIVLGQARTKDEIVRTMRSARKR